MTGLRTYQTFPSHSKHMCDAFRGSIVKEQLARRKDRNNLRIDLTHPFFMYLDDRQGRKYEAAINSVEMQSTVYKPMDVCYRNASIHIKPTLPSAFDYIDLGPGYKGFLDSFSPLIRMTSGLRFYVPVDINRYLLRKICQHLKSQSIATVPMNCLFEDAATHLELLQVANGILPRVVNFGLTFNNYRPSVGIALLKGLVGPNGIAIICGEELNDFKTERILAAYRTRQTLTFNSQVIGFLGLPEENLQFVVDSKNSRVEMGFSINVSCSTRQGFQFLAGDYIATCISYRHQLDRLRSTLAHHFSTVSIAAETVDANNLARHFVLTVSSGGS